MKYIRLLILLICVLACNKQSISGFTTYIIKKGQHESVRNFSTLTSDELVFECKFDNSAEYYLDSASNNQYDINKLLGFSECNTFHHSNSARFGWRWLNGGIEIHAYVYNNGVRNTKLIKSVQPNETHNYSILIDGDKYVFSVDGVVVLVSRTNNCNVGLYYRLYPYFGGDEVAPHNIKILINEPLSR